MRQLFNNFCLYYIKTLRTPGDVLMLVCIGVVVSALFSFFLKLRLDWQVWLTCLSAVLMLVPLGVLVVNGLRLRSVQADRVHARNLESKERPDNAGTD